MPAHRVALLTQDEAVQYIKKTGYEISRPTLQREIKRGHLVPEPQGGISIAELDRYLSIYGRKSGKNIPKTAVFSSPETSTEAEQQPAEHPQPTLSTPAQMPTEKRFMDVAERKELAVAEKAEADAGLAKLKLQLAQGKVVPREQFVAEMASRLVILREGFRLAVESRVQEIIAACGGKAEEYGAVVGLVSSLLDDQLTNYSKPIEFTAIIDENGAFKEGDEDE